jgi:hypothetical protein
MICDGDQDEKDRDGLGTRGDGKEQEHRDRVGDTEEGAEAPGSDGGEAEAEGASDEVTEDIARASHARILERPALPGKPDLRRPVSRVRAVG